MFRYLFFVSFFFRFQFRILFNASAFSLVVKLYDFSHTSVHKARLPKQRAEGRVISQSDLHILQSDFALFRLCFLFVFVCLLFFGGLAVWWHILSIYHKAILPKLGIQTFFGFSSAHTNPHTKVFQDTHLPWLHHHLLTYITWHLIALFYLIWFFCILFCFFIILHILLPLVEWGSNTGHSKTGNIWKPE